MAGDGVPLWQVLRSSPRKRRPRETTALVEWEGRHVIALGPGSRHSASKTRLWLRPGHVTRFPADPGLDPGESRDPALRSAFLLRGGERKLLLRPSSLFRCQRARCDWGELQIDKRKSAPVSALGQGIALIPLSSVSLTSRGMARRQGARPGSPGRRWHGLRPGPGRETSRPAPCGAPTRHLRLTPQSAIGPRQELFVPGRFSRGRPWVRIALLPARRCRSRSPLSRRLMKTPSTMDRDRGNIGSVHPLSSHFRGP